MPNECLNKISKSEKKNVQFVSNDLLYCKIYFGWHKEASKICISKFRNNLAMICLISVLTSFLLFLGMEWLLFWEMGWLLFWGMGWLLVLDQLRLLDRNQIHRLHNSFAQLNDCIPNWEFIIFDRCSWIINSDQLGGLIFSIIELDAICSSKAMKNSACSSRVMNILFISSIN